MVLRRCHYIVVSDAGEDPECSFADLGDAVRKIRIDLGISTEFGSMSIYLRCEDAEQNQKGRNCAIGRICYSMLDGAGTTGVHTLWSRWAIKIIFHIRERALHRGFAAPLAGPRPWGA